MSKQSSASPEAQHMQPPKILAYFSTDGGKHEPRPASSPRDPVIVRSNFEKDVQDYCTRLRKEYPKACYSIFPQWDIRWYFDEYDFERQGGLFLYTVLMTLMEENGKRVVTFCQEFAEKNRATFPDWAERALTPIQLFHERDYDEFGPQFMHYARDCLVESYEKARAERLSAVNRSKHHSRCLWCLVITANKTNRYCGTWHSVPSSREQHYWCIHCQRSCYTCWYIPAFWTTIQHGSAKSEEGQHKGERKERVSSRALTA